MSGSRAKDGSSGALPTGYVTLIASVLVALLLGLSAWLHVAGFESSHLASFSRGVTVAADDCRKHIEYGVHYGKPLAKFHGMPQLLRVLRDDIPELRDVFVVDGKGTIVADGGGTRLGRTLAPKLVDAVTGKAVGRTEREAKGTGRLSDVTRVSRDGSHFVVLPVRDASMAVVGGLVARFDDASLGSTRVTTVRVIVRTYAGLAVLAALAIALVLRLRWIGHSPVASRRRRLMAGLLPVACLAQVAGGAIALHSVQRLYEEAAMQTATSVGRVLQRNINAVSGKGVPLGELGVAATFLRSTTESVPELGGVSLVDTKSSAVIATTFPTPSESGTLPDYSIPLATDSAGAEGRLDVYLSRGSIAAKLRAVMLDLGTLVVVSLLLSIELVLFLLWWVSRRDSRTDATAPSSRSGTPDADARLDIASVIRPLSFVFYLSADLAVTFLSVRMADLYRPVAWLPPDVVLALPISVEMLAAALSTVFAGGAIDRRGWRAAFVVGLSLLVLGTLGSGFADSPLAYVLSRAVVGAGYGAAWMAMRGLIAAQPTHEERARGFGAFNAGLYTASACAGVLGAILADRVGMAHVFLLGALGIFVSGLLALRLTSGVSGAPKARDARPSQFGAPRDRNSAARAIALLLLVTVPSAACATGFVVYWFPLFASAEAVSRSDVGRAFMAYALLIAYLGPVCASWVARLSVRRTHRAVALGGVLGVLGLATFALTGKVWVAVLGVAIFGMADALGYVSQNSLLLGLEWTHRAGTGKGLALLSMAKKAGQMLGPLVFGWLVSAGTFRPMIWVALAYGACLLLFVIVYARGREEVCEGGR